MEHGSPQPDDNTIYSAGNQLTLSGTTFNVTEGAGSGLDADLLDGQTGIYYLDNTDAQDLTLSGNTLALTGDASSVDLSGYLDNTDSQDLTLTGNTLALTGDGTTVDLSAYLDNTDAQNLSYTTATGAVDISGGTGIVVPLATATSRGLVNPPNNTTTYLRGDGTWVTPTDDNTIYSAGKSTYAFWHNIQRYRRCWVRTGC